MTSVWGPGVPNSTCSHEAKSKRQCECTKHSKTWLTSFKYPSPQEATAQGHYCKLCGPPSSALVMAGQGAFESQRTVQGDVLSVWTLNNLGQKGET